LNVRKVEDGFLGCCVQVEQYRERFPDLADLLGLV
jgi:hypothetical protein